MPSLEIRDPLRNGLRPRRDMQRNEQYLRDCANRIPTERGCVAPLPVTFPVDDTLSMSWPFPMILRDERMMMYMKGDTAYTLDTSAYPYVETAKTVYGSQNLALNPYFITDTTWNKGVGWTITGGQAVATGAINTNIDQGGVTDGTSAYLVIHTQTRSAGSLTPTLGTQAGTARSTSGTFAEVITAATNGQLIFDGTGFTGTLDNVYVYKVAALSSSGAWQMVAFQDRIAFLGNGNTLLFLKPGNAEISGVPQWQRTEDLAVDAIGKHNNALVFGGMSGTRLSESVVTTLFSHWKELEGLAGQLTTEDDTLDSSYIFFSAPGGAENDRPFTLFLAALGIGGNALNDVLRGDIDSELEYYRIGFFRPKWCGPIRALKQCGNDLIAYGRDGVSRLVRNETGYMEQKLIEHGIPSRTAVCGDESGHVCVTTHDELWLITPDGGATCLHYSEHIANLTAASIVASYDPVNKHYHFADGTYNYVLSMEQGRPALGNSNAVIPSSLVRIENTADLYGTAITASNPTAAFVQVVAVSQPDQTVFDVSSIDVEISEVTADDVTVTTDTRMAKSGPYKRPSTLTTVDDRGRGFCKRTGSHQRPYVRIADYRAGALSGISLNIGQGRRSIAATADQSDTVLTETYP
jgi:hypothetical protein